MHPELLYLITRDAQAAKALNISSHHIGKEQCRYCVDDRSTLLKSGSAEPGVALSAYAAVPQSTGKRIGSDTAE